MTITTRAGKGTPLTNAELDANFTELRDLKAPLAGPSFTGAVTTTGVFTKANDAATASQFMFVAGSTTAHTYGNIVNTTGSLAYGVESSAGGAIFSGSSAYASVFGSSSATAVQFATSNTVRMTISATGNLLIGTTTDNGTDKLQVNGSVKAAGNVGIGTSSYTLGSALQIGRLFSFAADINSGSLGAGWLGDNAAQTYAVTGNYAVRAYFDSALGHMMWSTAASGTAGAAVAWTERMRLAQTGNLLIGTTSDNGTDKLQVNGGAFFAGSLKVNGVFGGSAGMVLTNTTVNNYGILKLQGDGSGGGQVVFFSNGTTTGGVYGNTTGLSLYTGTSSIGIKIASTGNVLIGTTTDNGTDKLQVTGSALVNGAFSITAVANTNVLMSMSGSGAYSTILSMGSGGAGVAQIKSTTNSLLLDAPTDKTIALGINGVAVATARSTQLDVAGSTYMSASLLVGAVSFGASPGVSANANGSSYFYNQDQANGWAWISFGRTGALIGSITQSGTTGVAYNTTSDYRLKSEQKPLIGSGAFIDALAPKTWVWADGSPGTGFIAHEFQAVSPASVTGEKDAVDAEGRPKYQAMQASSAEVMANIIAELQSLRIRVAQLESI